MLFKRLFLLASVFLAGILSSCTEFSLFEPEPIEEETKVVEPVDPLAKPLKPSSWNDSADLTGAPKIVISVKDQEALFYKGNTLVGTAAVSTGKYGRGTPRGTYKVLEKNFVRYSSAFGVIRDKDTHEIIMPDFDTRKDKMPRGGYYEPARMAYCLRFYNGFCFHEGRVPGYPASHGCVRIVPDMAPLFYENARVGMTFIVK